MRRYIDVTELSKQISDFKRAVNSPNSDYLTGYLCALSVTEGMIAGTPSADVVEVRHGEWREVNDKYPRYVCTVCNHLFNNKNYNYCPYCGAKMDGERKE